MQRVVRFSLIGLLATAGLTACGDKVTVPPQETTPVSLVVRSVTVTPASATLNQGDKITLVASVNADAGVTDRTVTWTSANTAIASVDANGVVTAGTTAGTTTISAASKADPTVKGAALITVNAGAGQGAQATVTISTVNQTVCVVGGGCNSVPANLGNVSGQIDVTVNVDPGAQRLVGVDLVLNCTGNGNSGQDSVVATQTLASQNVAVDASAASAPVTLSFNTASFNTTSGAVAFRNGSCTIKAKARTNATAGGPITTVTSTSQTITLNNNDVVIGSLTSTKNAINPTTGLVWNGGDVTVTATPVMFSGRVPATVVITFECRPQTVTGAGTKTVTYVDGNDFPATLTNATNVPGGGCTAGLTPPTGNPSPAANDIDNITNPSSAATFALVDAAGAAFTTNPCGAAALCSANSVLGGAAVAITPIRLDTQKPLLGTFALAGNLDQGIGGNPWLGANFRFAADSAAGFRGPDAAAGNQTRNLDNRAGQTAPTNTAGVDAVTYVFQSATSATGTFTSLTAASSLDETATFTSRVLRIIATDALGNADTAFANGSEFIASNTAAGLVPTRFGVDKTPPVVGTVTGVADQTANRFLSNGVYHFGSITDNLSGTGLIYVAQTRLWNGANTVANGGGLDPNFLEGRTYSNTNNPGVINTDPTLDNSPCMIGRFNQTQAKASSDAVAVFDRNGAPIGFCSPVPYTLSVNGDLFVNTTGFGGYFKSAVIATDQAGNRAPAFTATVLENLTTPAVNNIDMPASITGNATASFPASVSETSTSNVGDITASWGTLLYTGVTNGATANSDATANVNFRFADVAGPGVAFDNVLTRSATATPTVSNFFKNLWVSTAQAGNTASFAGQTPVPTGTSSAALATTNVTSVTVSAKDPAINANGTPNVGSLTANFAPAVQISAGASSTFSTNFNGGFRDSVSTNAVSACSGTCTAANPTSVTLFAIAQGKSGLLANPFVGGVVTFWYRVVGTNASTNPWFFINSTTTGVTSDIGNDLVYPGRSWIFSTSWTPSATAPDGTKLQQIAGNTVTVQIRAVGVNTNGDAVGTLGTTQIVLSNP